MNTGMRVVDVTTGRIGTIPAGARMEQAWPVRWDDGTESAVANSALRVIGETPGG